jgi:hypothetical protein
MIHSVIAGNGLKTEVKVALCFGNGCFMVSDTLQCLRHLWPAKGQMQQNKPAITGDHTFPGVVSFSRKFLKKV